ncbi:MAG: DUF3530 family protein [Gammaproteobacteria bacterium]|nr:DUF3530 family protein [Gammaproteobacteria bacterium]
MSTLQILSSGLLALLLILFIDVEIIAAESEASKAELVEPPSLRNDRILAEQLGDSQAKWLTAGKTEFLGIFNADTSGKTVGSLLILPTPGRSAKSLGILTQLIDELSSKGWNTLGISLPIFDFSAPSPSFPEAQTTTEALGEESDNAPTESPQVIPDAKKWYADQETKNMAKLLERILAAEDELLAKGDKYVLLAQGATAELVLELISSRVIKPAGLITLNLQHPIKPRTSLIVKNLSAIKIPVLDVSNLSNKGPAHNRKLKLNSDNYKQLVIPGSGIDFRGSELLVIKRIRGWLKNTLLNLESSVDRL